ncbi:MAG: hypothetical protein IPJ09_05135 [Saprospiraceae bacterium]|nr:hypothetical protein [Saprospiraceae bacterium]MBL0113629.1 hypothetical protein [Saprospiraceae bacterium]
MNKLTVLKIISFLLFAFGFLTFLLEILGLEFSFLNWLDRLPGVAPLLLKVSMLFGGILLAYIAFTDWQKQE